MKSKYMHCPSCKRDIPKGIKFCPYCGYKVSKYDLHNVEKKLSPKHSPSPITNSHDFNPEHISKKAKILFGCIIAAAIIGGGIHHYHYRQTTASVNLSQQMSDKNYRIGNFLDLISDIGGSDYNSNTDRQNIANYYKGKFHGGKVHMTYKGHHAVSPLEIGGSTQLNYSIQGKEMTLNITGSDDSGDSDGNQYFTAHLKLIHTDESHKDLTFKVTSDSDEIDGYSNGNVTNNSDTNTNDSNQQTLNSLVNHKITFKQD